MRSVVEVVAPRMAKLTDNFRNKMQLLDDVNTKNQKKIRQLERQVKDRDDKIAQMSDEIAQLRQIKQQFEEMQGLKKSDEIFDDMMKNNKINIDQLKVIHDQLKSDWD